MKRNQKPSRVVEQAIEQFKRNEITRKQFITILKQYPNEPIDDLVPEYRRREQQEMIANGKIPKGAIIANLDKQAPNGSYDCKAYYQDMEYRCKGCGKTFTWTAKEQQWWYESVKGPIYSQIKHCRNCYLKHKAEKEAQRESSQPK
jgi:hypothetical protein